MNSITKIPDSPNTRHCLTSSESPSFTHSFSPGGHGYAVVSEGFKWEPIVSPTPLNDLARRCREGDRKFDFNIETGEPVVRNTGEWFMLIVSELSEAFEGVRKNLMDDHLPHRKAVEVELADALIRTLAYAAREGLDLDGAVDEKLIYNETRQDHSREARLAPNGKKW